MAERPCVLAVVRAAALLVLGAAGVSLAAPPGPAPKLPPEPPASRPQAEVLLRVSTPGGVRTFTARQLRALPMVRYRTVQPQLGSAHLYEGVLLRVLAERLGLAGRDLTVGAADRYSAVVSASDYMAYPIMLAYNVDWRPGRFENKGPLQIVLPTHLYPERFPRVKYGSQWVWYVNSLSPAP